MEACEPLRLEDLRLERGSHDSPDEGMCAMEAVAVIAGEPFSDTPACVSLVITEFLRSWDGAGALGNDDRDRLFKPLLLDVLDTATGRDDDITRAWMAVDWLVRICVPTWLRLPGLGAHADLLAASSPLDAETAPAILPPLKAALSAAYAAGAAARAAANATAPADARWDAAGAGAAAAAQGGADLAAAKAARDAAGATARFRGRTWATAPGADLVEHLDAACAAAGASAGAAAWGAVARRGPRDAAWDALAPTIAGLQASAQQLVRDMAAVGRGGVGAVSRVPTDAG